MLTVNEAGLSELDAIAPLFDAYRQFYGQAADLPAARGFLHERLARKESTVFLAQDGTGPVGFTQVYPSFSSVSVGRIFILTDLYVDPRARQQGIGARLLKATVDYAAACGARRVELTTARTNHTAQALYEAEGWVRDEVFYIYRCAVQR